MHTVATAALLVAAATLTLTACDADEASPDRSGGTPGSHQLGPGEDQRRLSARPYEGAHCDELYVDAEEPPPAIIGPLDLDASVVESSVAFLVASAGGMPTRNPEASRDLGQVLSDALAGECSHDWRSVHPFEDQGACTAFLIGENLVMTALHCYDLPPNWECPDGASEFGCRLPQVCGGSAPNELSGQVLGFNYIDHEGDWDIGTNLRVEACGAHDGTAPKDWMVLSFTPRGELGKHCPLELPAHPMELCAPVNMVGHPLGHPQHRSGGTSGSKPSAWVSRLNPDGSVETTLDAISSYSGSPVFSSVDGSLVGLHTDGLFAGNGDAACGLIKCDPEGCTDPLHESSVLDLSTILLPDHLDLSTPEGC